MKTRFLAIIGIVTVTFAFPLAWFDQVYASCMAENEINWNGVLSESELAFTGTVTRLDNYDGPQKVTFFIHDVIKGEVNAPKHVLENSELVFLENDTVMSSSVNVDYKIGKTYKVYVENGKTNQCTTKLTAPPADYVWEPGPEDGNYYSEKEDIPSSQYQDANERKSYRDALSRGSVVLPADSPKLTDKELDDLMDGLFSHGLDHTELPIASIAVDYERDILVLWTPDLTIGNKVQELMDDVPFVLLYEESPVRWTHDGPLPEPEPEPDRPIPENCGPGTTLQEGICVVNSENNDTATSAKWEDTLYEKQPPPDLKLIRDDDYGFIYVIVLLTFIIAGGTIAGLIFTIKRKRK